VPWARGTRGAPAQQHHHQLQCQTLAATNLRDTIRRYKIRINRKDAGWDLRQRSVHGDGHLYQLRRGELPANPLVLNEALMTVASAQIIDFQRT